MEDKNYEKIYNDLKCDGRYFKVITASLFLISLTIIFCLSYHCFLIHDGKNLGLLIFLSIFCLCGIIFLGTLWNSRLDKTIRLFIENKELDFKIEEGSKDHTLELEKLKNNDLIKKDTGK